MGPVRQKPHPEQLLGLLWRN